MLSTFDDSTRENPIPSICVRAPHAWLHRATAQLAEVQLEGGAVEGEGKGEMLSLSDFPSAALSRIHDDEACLLCVCVYGGWRI
jgi:hypothetical protein